jgi:hypothetical protein
MFRHADPIETLTKSYPITKTGHEKLLSPFPLSHQNWRGDSLAPSAPALHPRALVAHHRKLPAAAAGEALLHFPANAKVLLLPYKVGLDKQTSVRKFSRNSCREREPFVRRHPYGANVRPFFSNLRRCEEACIELSGRPGRRFHGSH